MKTVSIYSMKGGMGKTSLTVMFASWLNYEKGIDVKIADYEPVRAPIRALRDKELQMLKRGETREDLRLRKLSQSRKYYGIGKVDQSIYASSEAADTMVRQLKKARMDESMPGYYLLDFPGTFNDNDPVTRICAAGQLDVMVVLIDSDPQTLDSLRMVYRRTPDVKKLVLWTRETGSERRRAVRMETRGGEDYYATTEREITEEFGLEICPVRIHDIDCIRYDADHLGGGFVRSTTCWPAGNVATACPYITDIFSWILERI